MKQSEGLGDMLDLECYSVCVTEELVSSVYTTVNSKFMYKDDMSYTPLQLSLLSPSSLLNMHPRIV